MLWGSPASRWPSAAESCSNDHHWAAGLDCTRSNLRMLKLRKLAVYKLYLWGELNLHWNLPLRFLCFPPFFCLFPGREIWRLRWETLKIWQHFGCKFRRLIEKSWKMIRWITCMAHAVRNIFPSFNRFTSYYIKKYPYLTVVLLQQGLRCDRPGT